MSMLNGMGRAPDVGETVASFRDYDGALKAVSKLIAAEVPARDIAIVGTALRSVERVTGRLGWAQAAWSGALNGVLLGLFFGAMVVIWTPNVPMAAFAGMLLLGIAMGMLFRLVSYTMVRRRRDFASVMQVTADHYEVSVQPGSLAKAKQVLGTAQAAPTRPVDPRTITEPPRFGVRVDPTTGRPIPPERPSEAQPGGEERAGSAQSADEGQPASDRPAGSAEPQPPADPEHAQPEQTEPGHVEPGHIEPGHTGPADSDAERGDGQPPRG